MGTSSRRAATLWLVGAAVVGGLAALLHVMRSDLGGAHTSLGLTVSAYVLTALAALMIYRGIVVAARAQDAADPPRATLPTWWDQEPYGYQPIREQWPERDWPDDPTLEAEQWRDPHQPADPEPFRPAPAPPTGWQAPTPQFGRYGPSGDAPADDDDVYTFRRGKKVDGR